MRRRQTEILAFIKDFIARHPYPPSLWEITEGCGLSSPSVAQYNLRLLERRGFLTRIPANRPEHHADRPGPGMVNNLTGLPNPGKHRMKIACVLITHLRAKVEMRRQPRLKDRPVLIVERRRGRSLVIDHFPAASGVTAGMTLEQALSRQSGGIELEADESGYRQVFRRMLLSLQGVSDRVEGSELGTAYVGLDGLEALYGGEARLVTALLNAAPQDLAPRAGVGDAKFPAYVAARTSQPLGAAKVPPDAPGFLAPRPVDLLPVPHRVRDELRRFGLHTLGDIAAMNVIALTDRFGPEGRQAWELAQGIDGSPLAPLKHEERIVEHANLPFASASLEPAACRGGYPAAPRLRPAPDAGPVRRRGIIGMRHPPAPALAERLPVQATRRRLGAGFPHSPGTTGGGPIPSPRRRRRP